MSHCCRNRPKIADRYPRCFGRVSRWEEVARTYDCNEGSKPLTGPYDTSKRDLLSTLLTRLARCAVVKSIAIAGAEMGESKRERVRRVGDVSLQYYRLIHGLIGGRVIIMMMMRAWGVERAKTAGVTGSRL